MLTMRIDLPELPAEYVTGGFIEIKHPRLVPWKFKRELAKAVGAGRAAEDRDLRAVADFAAQLIVSTNLLDLETGEPVAVPLSAEIIDERLPSLVVEKISDAVGDQSPNGTTQETPS